MVEASTVRRVHQHLGELLWVHLLNRREDEMLTTEIVRAKCGEHAELLMCWSTININAAEESSGHDFSGNVLEGQRREWLGLP